MKNKYKVGDKLYFGYFTGDTIEVEEHIVTEVFADSNKLEMRDVISNSLGCVPFSWIYKSHYFDTYEEAYNYAVKRVRTKLIEALAKTEEKVCILKNKIAKFEEKYGKED